MNTPITRRGALGLIGTSAFSLLGAGALAGCSNGGGASGAGTVTVGSKAFTEGVILSELYALALEDAGMKVDRAFEISGSLIHTALVEGDIDLYPEYTGTGLISVLKMEPKTDPEEVYAIVKDEYKKQFDLVWLEKSPAADGQGLVIRTQAAKELGIKTISDMQAHAGELRFASQGQFDERPDGLPALEATYGPFAWAEHEVYDEGLKYQVLENDQADVTPAYTTEAQLTNDAFTLLEDDKRVWPPYNVAPVVRAEVLAANPGIEEALARVDAALTTEKLTELNARVDIDKEEYEDVAREFFESL
ncbi:glycine/betaine ABC transporter substrate-binding protein [Collinsella sp. BA40]|uniref:glycine betaine ABC transporter substrate-binding protein n=1 Tax=Collinsella sp. BA40 TaxID=2560852 RepID=UPI0011CBF9AA|nr:glycine betaine ABC transporter substrate-binding protein [Collinsella sp. BA40]TXF37529.1 glycine/betaine ABC transporter substrate-binding protein [Collinsella sp. BA40]